MDPNKLSRACMFGLQILMIAMLGYHMFGQYLSSVNQQAAVLVIQKRLLEVQEDDTRRDLKRWLDITERMDRIEIKLVDHVGVRKR